MRCVNSWDTFVPITLSLRIKKGYWVSQTFLIIGKATDDGNETCVTADGLVRFSIHVANHLV